MSIVGFDFGTTNSLLSVIRGSRAVNFLDDQQRPIPSIVCYEGAQKIVGRKAKERLDSAGLGVQGNIVRSPKIYLGKDSVFVEGIEKSPVDMVADVVSHVLEEARGGARELGNLSGAVVTIPVSMEGYRRRALRDAFRQAGLPIYQFVHEPLAALYGFFRSKDLSKLLRRYEGKLILVFDWGGGTLDLTLCRLRGDMVVQVMNDGTDEVGGDEFDEAIMNRLIRNVGNQGGLGEEVEYHGGAKARLLARCERAKIDLSSRSDVAIYVQSFYRGGREEEFDYELGQEELEQIVSPLLDKGFQRITKILQDADYTPEQVALCVATGGMSNMPAVKRRLHELFGPQRVEIPDGTATLIAEGAAWIAHDQAALHLAKNVELVLARNSYLPLVKAGTVMPTEGQVESDDFHLYCADPRDGWAKFQICAPRQAGSRRLRSDPRVILENLTVRVDSEARAFEERLELSVQIDEDLVLKAHARSLNKGDEDCQEIHNLEFGLSFPSEERIVESGESDEEDTECGGGGEAHSVGALSLRANLATCRSGSLAPDLSLVPGEFLCTYHPQYFDTRQNPPQQQVVEMLYYEPCAVCGRAANDPACRCSDQPMSRQSLR